MQRAVGEGRAVVQVEQGLALVLFQQLVVKIQLLPVLEHLRLPLGQTCPHGKAALGHVQCAFVLHDVPPYMCIEKTKLKTNEKPRRVCRPQAANNSNHFSPRHVRGEKFLSGCKCGIFVLCAKIMRAAACNPFGRKNEVFSPVKNRLCLPIKRQRR